MKIVKQATKQAIQPNLIFDVLSVCYTVVVKIKYINTKGCIRLKILFF